MTTDLRIKLIQKGWVTEFNADTLVRLIEEHYAALADEPAVPKGGEPVAVTGQPSDEQLLDTLDRATADFPPRHPEAEGLNAVEYPLALELRKARAVLARWGTPAPTLPADVSQLSDGYHTFAELYEHRHSLMLALMRAQPHICWFSRRHADGELPFGSDGWFIVGAELPDAPITYHLPAGLYSLAQKTGAIELPAGRPWDGHTAADVVRRLRVWAITPPPPADGEVAELVAKLRKLCSDLDYDDRGEEAGYCYRAADLLQRLSPPVLVPVPVSEGLPGSEDCDAEHYCWRWNTIGGLWTRQPLVRKWYEFESHWLPAHALPLPGQEVGE